MQKMYNFKKSFNPKQLARKQFGVHVHDKWIVPEREKHRMVFNSPTKLSVFSRCLFASQKSFITVNTSSGARNFLKPMSV